MEIFTVRIPTQFQRGLPWSQFRELVMLPVPRLAGLQGRVWSLEQRNVVVRYVFAEQSATLAIRERLLVIDQDLQRVDPAGEISTDLLELPFAAEDSFCRPVLILAAPRTGSTLLHQLLCKCEDVCSIDSELQSFIDGIPALRLDSREYESQELDERDADETVASTLRSCLLAALNRPNGSKSGPDPEPRQPRFRLIDKTCENVLRIPFLLKVLPDAQLIFLHRDVRQNVSSLVEAWNHAEFASIPDLPGWSRKSWKFLLPRGWQRYNSATLSEVAAFQWRAANESVLHALEGLSRDRWISLSYEDLIANPQEQVERLCEFLHLRPSTQLRQELRQPASSLANDPFASLNNQVEKQYPLRFTNDRLTSTNRWQN